MRALLWRVVEWHLSRHLAPDRLAPTLGDLTEDVAKREAAIGRLRAQLWLVRESLSVAEAYRSRNRHAHAASRTPMTILHLEDARLAVRRLRKQPAASLASILTLACAIGAAAATWSVLSATLLHPLPVSEPDRLFTVGAQTVLKSGELGRTSQSHIYPFVGVVRDSGAFDRVTAYGTEAVLLGTGDAPRQGLAGFATTDFFGTLGLRPAFGRWFSADEDRRGAPPVAVVSHRFWRATLGADPDVLGREIRIGHSTAVIVGVAPPEFRGLNLAEAPDVYLPFHTVANVASQSTNYFADSTRKEDPTAWITIVGRRRPDLTPAQTLERLDGLSLEARRGRVFSLTPINAAAIPEAARAGMAQFTSLLAGTVGLLLLIGCLTVGMLLLIRTEARRDELAMCLALGASRARLARGIAIEGALLSFAGAAAALPVAWWLFGGLGTFELPGGVDIGLLSLSIDAGVLLATAGAAVVSTLFIAGVAATFGFSANVADVLRSRAGASPRVTRRRTHRALVAAQVAVAVVLVAGTGLFARSLIAALQLNPGFDTGRIVTATISLTPYGYSPARATAFFDELRETLEAIPALASVSLIQPQGGMTPSGKIIVDGVPRGFPSLVAYTAIDAEYFTTMGLRILNGRDFAPTDTATPAPVIIVSESFGRLLADGGNPVGHRITESSRRPDGSPTIAEIVGVVPDVITNLNVSEPLVKYYPAAQSRSLPHRTLVLRAAGDADAAMRETMAAIKAIDPAVTPGTMMTMEQRLLRQMGAQQLGIVVLGALGTIAVLLTVLGTYVLAASMAAVRRREIGIRAALGASRAQLGRLMLTETLRLVTAGLALGLVLVWLGAGTIRTFLYRVEPLDAMTLGLVAVVMLALTLAVSLRPAIAAARVDLAGVLREE